MVKESGYCSSHPFVKTNWQCTDCGREFCEDCVTPLRHSMSHLNRTAVCPECKGRCIDFQHIKNLADEQQVKEKAKRRKAVRLLLGISAAGAVVVPLFILKAPTELVILTFLLLGASMSLARWHSRAQRWFGFGSLSRLVFHDDPKQYHVHPALLVVLGIIVILVVLLLKHFPSWGLK